VDPKALNEFGHENNRAAIGTGPYYIQSYSAGELLVLKANTRYAIPNKTPHIETVNLYVIPNSDTAVSAFLSGEINWMKSQTLEQVYTVQDSGKFKDIVYIPSPVLPFCFNMAKNPIFQKPKVREALAKLIDWDGICSLVFDNINIPATSLWPQNTPGYVNDSAYYYHNPTEGLQILREAGVNPRDIKFSILCNPATGKVATAIQAQLAQYNISVSVDQVEVSMVTSQMGAGNWEVAASHMGYSEIDILGPYTRGLAPGGRPHYFTFDAYDKALNDQLVALYNKAATSPTYEGLRDNHREITRILQENYVFLGGYQGMEFVFHADNIRNIVMLSVMGNPEFCYSYIEN
jgi:ABC-type transport system substrate-binding protein